MIGPVRSPSAQLEAEFELLAVAPDDPEDRAAWRARVTDWRRRARGQLMDDDTLYREPASAWASSAHVCGVVMLWDESFFDPQTQEFLVEDYLDKADDDFGGFDVLVLWHAYPRIGFDDRNQFDFYRDIPGGIAALTDIVDRLHARGVMAILDYNPWDTQTRREPTDDGETLAALVAASGADGLFLDTMAQASSALHDAVATVAPGIVLQSEHLVPLANVRDHLLTWAQWPQRLNENLLLRNKWFEPRQMEHIVRRWHDDHRDELHVAWLNGAGVVLWENVFGSWMPWSAADKQILHSMRSTWDSFSDFFLSGTWTPFVSTGAEGVQASRWDLRGATLWTIANRTDAEATVTEFLNHVPDTSSVRDLTSGQRLEIDTRSIKIAGRGVSAVIAFADDAADGATFESRERIVVSGGAAPNPSPSAGPSELESRNLVRVSSPPTLRAHAVPKGMHPVVGGPRALTSIFRLRECGTYGPAPLRNAVEPDLSVDVTEFRVVDIPAMAIDAAPVTNAEFRVFLDSTGYLPPITDHFLDHWVDGRPRIDDESNPVTFVDLLDARQYANWAGRRLASEHEWHTAMIETAASFGRRRVWEWTESEHSDGHSRFVILKGGTDDLPGDPGWNAERGPLPPDRSAKFMLFSPGIDRCSTVGFRCAIDLNSCDI